MGITIDGMGVIIIVMLMEGKVDRIGIPQMETPIEMGKYGVGPMELEDGKVDITGIPLDTLMDGFDGSTTLDETLGPNMMWGSLNKEKGSLKNSLTWTSMGVS